MNSPITLRFDHAWVTCKQTCTHAQPCCGLACNRPCGAHHTHSCSCTELRIAPPEDQIGPLIDFEEAVPKASPTNELANGPVVDNGSSMDMKRMSTPESWQALANGSGDSSYLNALHKARKASSMEGPRVATVTETFIPVKSSNGSRESPVDVSSEGSSLLLD